VRVKTHEILTPAQNAQEALELERERSRRERCVKERDGPEKQMPTPEAVAVLQNEAARHKTISARPKRPPHPGIGQKGRSVAVIESNYSQADLEQADRECSMDVPKIAEK
jgi:hypothetical protein